MKFTIQRSELSRALALISAIAPMRKTADPRGDAARYARLTSRDGHIDLVATNFEASLFMTLEADVEEEFSVCFPYKQLQSLTKILSDEITITEKAGKALVKSGKSRMSIPIMPEGMFPELPTTPELFSGQEVRIPIDLFLTMVDRVLVSGGRADVSKWTFSGLQVKVTKESLVVYACDGSQISKVSTNQHEYDGEEELVALIPTEAFSGLSSLMKFDKKGVLSIKISHNQALMYTEAGNALFRTLAGQYPDVEKTLKFEMPYSVTLKGEDFLQSLERAVFFSPQNGYCDFTFGAHKLLLETQERDLGSFSEELEIDFEHGYPIEIAINAKQVINCLKKSKGLIEFMFSEESRLPVYIKSDDERSTFQYLTVKYHRQPKAIMTDEGSDKEIVVDV